MLTQIQVDRTVCQGYGNRALAAPGAFDVDDEGLVVLLKEKVSDDRLTAIKQAAYDCPTDAISIVQDASV